MPKKISSFTDLNAWKISHLLVIEIYKQTSKFPNSETYSLIDQMRRCVVSITSNIAEGFSRKTTKEKIQYYYMSLGSLTELQNQLLVARDVGYLKNEIFTKLANNTIEVSKLINGMIKYFKNT